MQLPDNPSSSRRARPVIEDLHSRTSSNISRRFWLNCCSKVNFALLSPFSLCLATGDLKADAFARFISHDNEFFKVFDFVLQAAADCSDDDEAQPALYELKKDVLKAQTKHQSFLKKLVPDATLNSDIPPLITRYTESLARTATAAGDLERMPDAEKRKLPAYVLAALASSLRMCAFLATELKHALDPKNDTHPYRNWIEYYAADVFQASAQKFEELLDKLVVSIPIPDAEFEPLERVYFRSLHHIIDIFNQQSISQPLIAPLISGPNAEEHRLIFFSNFDFSCSIVNSSHLLADFAIDYTTPKEVHDDSVGRFVTVSSDQMEKKWKAIKDRYKEGYQKQVKDILHKKVKKFDYDRVLKLLEPLSDYDKEANSKVVDSGILLGLKFKHVMRMGLTLLLHTGCDEFFKTLLNNNEMEAEAHILSYCWSADLISASFSRMGNVKIYANELSFNEINKHQISVGMIRQVENPVDKVEVFRYVLKNTPTEDKRIMSVYVGHNVGDLLCLLEADIGIVFNCHSNLKLIGDKLKVSFVPLFNGLVKKQKELGHGASYFSSNKKKGVLYTVTSWDEIHCFIHGTRFYKSNEA